MCLLLCFLLQCDPLKALRMAQNSYKYRTYGDFGYFFEKSGNSPSFRDHNARYVFQSKRRETVRPWTSHFSHLEIPLNVPAFGFFSIGEKWHFSNRLKISYIRGFIGKSDIYNLRFCQNLQNRLFELPNSSYKSYYELIWVKSGLFSTIAITRVILWG